MNSFTKLGTCSCLLGLIDYTAMHLYAIISSVGVVNWHEPRSENAVFFYIRANFYCGL